LRKKRENFGENTKKNPKLYHDFSQCGEDRGGVKTGITKQSPRSVKQLNPQKFEEENVHKRFY